MRHPQTAPSPFLLIYSITLLLFTQPGNAQPTVTTSPLPGSERAKAAAARVTPSLISDLSAKGLRLGDPVFLRAFKEEAQLELWVYSQKDKTFQHFRTWPIAAQSGTLGPKLAEGDNQVPEGFYAVSRSGMNPNSNYHLSFNIGYPNDYDRQHNRTGSFIMVHGKRASIGCLAMTDEKIEEIYTLCDTALSNGQPFFRIHIFPFRMTKKRLAQETNNPYSDFWSQLQEGYNIFENTHLPPEVTITNGHYHFSGKKM